MVPYASRSWRYCSSSVARLRRSDLASASRALARWDRNTGIAIAARMPMMIMTTSNSTSEKPSSAATRSPRSCTTRDRTLISATGLLVLDDLHPDLRREPECVLHDRVVGEAEVVAVVQVGPYLSTVELDDVLGI